MIHKLHLETIRNKLNILRHSIRGNQGTYHDNRVAEEANKAIEDILPHIKLAHTTLMSSAKQVVQDLRKTSTIELFSSQREKEMFEREQQGFNAAFENIVNSLAKIAHILHDLNESIHNLRSSKLQERAKETCDARIDECVQEIDSLLSVTTKFIEKLSEADTKVGAEIAFLKKEHTDIDILKRNLVSYLVK